MSPLFPLTFSSFSFYLIRLFSSFSQPVIFFFLFRVFFHNFFKPFLVFFSASYSLLFLSSHCVFFPLRFFTSYFFCIFYSFFSFICFFNLCFFLSCYFCFLSSFLYFISFYFLSFFFSLCLSLLLIIFFNVFASCRLASFSFSVCYVFY